MESGLHLPRLRDLAKNCAAGTCSLHLYNPYDSGMLTDVVAQRWGKITEADLRDQQRPGRDRQAELAPVAYG